MDRWRVNRFLRFSKEISSQIGHLLDTFCVSDAFLGTMESRLSLRAPWTARRSNQSILNQSWIFIGRTDPEGEAPILWPPDNKEPTHWKRPWCWERLKAGEEGDNRGWDSWMAAPTWWTWVWASSGAGDCQRGLACCMQSMGLQTIIWGKRTHNHKNTREVPPYNSYSQRGWEGWLASLTQMDMNLSKLQDMTEQLNWIEGPEW